MKIFIIGGQVSSSEIAQNAEFAVLERCCHHIGSSLVTNGHTVLVCSPFNDAADIHVLKGIAGHPRGRSTRIEFHFVDLPEVRRQIEKVISGLELTQAYRIPHPPPQANDSQALGYAWLLCQLSALESSHATISIGGKPNGAANMLLLLAEGKRKPILPLPFLGGAAKQSFDRCRYELEDRLGDKFTNLQNECITEVAGEYVSILAEAKSATGNRLNSPSFFISYARERQADADHVG